MRRWEVVGTPFFHHVQTKASIDKKSGMSEKVNELVSKVTRYVSNQIFDLFYGKFTILKRHVH